MFFKNLKQKYKNSKEKIFLKYNKFFKIIFK